MTVLKWVYFYSIELAVCSHRKSFKFQTVAKTWSLFQRHFLPWFVDKHVHWAFHLSLFFCKPYRKHHHISFLIHVSVNVLLLFIFLPGLISGLFKRFRGIFPIANSFLRWGKVAWFRPTKSMVTDQSRQPQSNIHPAFKIKNSWHGKY